MDYLSILISLTLLGLVVFVLGFVIWFGWVLFFGSPTGSASQKSNFTDADEDDIDPNWEDHIRHDPYHPGGSGGHF